MESQGTWDITCITEDEHLLDSSATCARVPGEGKTAQQVRGHHLGGIVSLPRYICSL